MWKKQTREEWLKACYKSKGLKSEVDWKIRHAVRCGVGLSNCKCGWREYLQNKGR